MTQSAATVSRRVEEQLRRAAAESTRRIALHYGDRLPMWLGCGFPKSGTVWLCQLMGAYLQVPYPQNYRMPIAMTSVIHSHWKYDERFPTTGYITRDGRDVAVSLYFYYTRALDLDRSPARKAELQKQFEYLFGPNFDPNDSKANLPRFLEHEFTNPRPTHGMTWHGHVADWVGRPQVHHTRYEDLLEDTPKELARLMTEITGAPADETRAQAAAALYAFTSGTGRKRGEEDRSSFQRKGIAGDWRNHFTPEAAKIFQEITGGALITLGYEADDSWVETVR